VLLHGRGDLIDGRLERRLCLHHGHDQPGSLALGFDQVIDGNRLLLHSLRGHVIRARKLALSISGSLVHGLLRGDDLAGVFNARRLVVNVEDEPTCKGVDGQSEVEVGIPVVRCRALGLRNRLRLPQVRAGQCLDGDTHLLGSLSHRLRVVDAERLVLGQFRADPRLAVLRQRARLHVQRVSERLRPVPGLGLRVRKRQHAHGRESQCATNAPNEQPSLLGGDAQPLDGKLGVTDHREHLAHASDREESEPARSGDRHRCLLRGGRQFPELVDEVRGTLHHRTESAIPTLARLDERGLDRPEEDGEVTAEQKSVVFTVRWCSETRGLTSTGYRIRFREQLYDIESIDPMNFQKKTLKIHCRLERRKPDEQNRQHR
ncbi:MAG: head-tail adaptor protein, partial [Chloroflexia bacterium]|nr:head-tail adaptor protein [Chloroflexia bacterium]